MSDSKGMTKSLMGFTLLHPKESAATDRRVIPAFAGTSLPLRKQGDDGRKLLGIELPFGWCLVRGRKLRAMQKELREARQTAGIRLRMCGQFLEQIHRKESR